MITKSAAGTLSGTGTYKRTIDGEFPNDFFAVKKDDGKVYKSGVTMSTSTGATEIKVNLTTAGLHKFPQISEQKGISTNNNFFFVLVDILISQIT